MVRRSVESSPAQDEPGQQINIDSGENGLKREKTAEERIKELERRRNEDFGEGRHLPGANELDRQIMAIREEERLKAETEKLRQETELKKAREELDKIK